MYDPVSVNLAELRGYLSYAEARGIAEELAALVEARTPNTSVAAAIFDALTIRQPDDKPVSR